MKRLLIIPAAMALANCAAIPAAIGSIGGLTQAVSVNQDKVLVPATQALIVAHNAYQAAASAAATTIDTCSAANWIGPCAALKPRLDQIKALSDKAKSLLDQADAGQNVAQNAADVMNIVASLHSFSEL